MTPLRGLTTLLAALAALALAAPSFAADNAPQIQIGRTAFTPSTVTIAAGGSVNFVNRDTIDHQLTSTAAKLLSPNLTPTDNYGFTFATAGTFTVTDKTGITMTVTVTPAELVTVHLNPAKKAVVAGTAVKLNGNLDPGQSGQSVSVQAQPCGAAKFAGVTTATTASSGIFSVLVKPKNNTVYQVQVGNSKATVLVHVSPKITLTKLGGGLFRISVVGPATGTAISIQKLAGTKAQIIQTVKVASKPKTVRLKVPAGTRIRAAMNTHAAGQCLDAGQSNAVVA